MMRLEKLIAELSVLAAEYPDAPVSVQLPDGTHYSLDPEVGPYLYRGSIVFPIVKDTDGIGDTPST